MKHMCPSLCYIALGFSVAFAGGRAFGATSISDQKFVDFAAQTDMVEANLGSLAQSAGNSQAVKDYGQMLATDHTSDYQKLQSVAQQAGLTVPAAIDAQHNKSMIGPMHALKGSAFDKKFDREMAAGHSEAIAIYKKEAADAQNPALKAYAQETLATLQKHLDDSKNLEQGKAPAGQ
jgi:putative membrane protein